METSLPQSLYDLAASLPVRRFYRRVGHLRPITKPEAAAFNNAVMRLMKPWPVAGEVRNEPCAHITWVIPTEHYGALRVTLYMEQDILYTVYTRFDGTKEQLDRAVAELSISNSINPFSGKWNVHCSEAADALLTFARQLRAIEIPVYL